MKTPQGKIWHHLLAASLLLASLCGAAHGAITVQDDSGKTLSFASPPQRIITLMPSLTETVCALGACDRVVGVDRYSNYPEQVRKLPHLGGLDDTQVESIFALKPDVVIAATSSRVQDRLAALGLKVMVLETRSQADVQRTLKNLGALLGVADAQKIWQRIDGAVTEAAATVPASMRGLRVYYEVDSAPYAAGESSFIGETLARLGLRNIVDKSLGPFPKLNPEFVVRADPQLIMVSQRSGGNLSSRPGWANISAIRDHHICIFKPEESELLTRPGPRMAESAAIMARCLREMAVAKPTGGTATP